LKQNAENSNHEDNLFKLYVQGACIHTYLGRKKYVVLLGNKFKIHRVLDYRDEDLTLIKKTEE